MKKCIIAVAVAGLATGSVMAEPQSSAGLTVDFATAYVFRGATIVDELVVQPGAEISGFGMDDKYGEITVGAWGTVAPFSDVLFEDNFYETDWYVTYALPQMVEDLDLWIGYTAYQYVAGQEKELNFGAGYALGDFSFGSTLNFMTDSTYLLPAQDTEGQIYWDLYADYVIDINEKLSADIYALLGIMIEQGDGLDATRSSGINHYELGADLAYELTEAWGLGLGLAYIGQGDNDVLPNSAHDKGMLLTFGVGYEM
jgi:hypothetical protein